ncbi:MAG: transketolase C-terminal domain-containing protein [Alphaproteobacteria bacterium]
MRNAFAREVSKLASEDDRIILLSGDIGNNLFEDLKKVGADHFLNCGIAEANMMGVAAGMALSGLRPIVYTITPFTTTRCLEQIRVDVCYQNASVIIVGTGSGLSYAELGPTHQSLEDIAILRAFPSLTIMTPCDVPELIACLRAAMQHDGPVYMRIGKKGEPRIHNDDLSVKIGKAIELSRGEDLTFLVSGFIMPEALAAAHTFSERGFKVGVVSYPTIKPLDTELLTELCSRTKLLVTVEEHGSIGGLGSAVAEWRAPLANSLPLIIIGAKDEFIHVIGDQDYARGYFGISAEKIVEKVATFLGGT